MSENSDVDYQAESLSHNNEYDPNQNQNDENNSEENEQEINNQENAEKLADQAGETIFTNIYKNVKNEIKDTIITKLLYKIEEQEIKIQNLENENKKLKDDYTYVLKRILLNKSEFYNNNFNNYNNNNSKYFITNESYTNMNNSVALTHKKNRTNMTTDDTNEISDNGSIENNEKQNMDNKVKKYLNNLFKKNFVNITDGTSTSHYIGKKVNIYEELFPVNNMVNNESCHRNRSLKRDRSIQNRKPKIRLEMRDIKYSNVMDTEISTNKENNKNNKNKKIKIYQANNTSAKKAAKHTKNNSSCYESKGDKEKYKIYYKKNNVLNSSDPNRKLKFKYGYGVGNKTPYATSKYLK